MMEILSRTDSWPMKAAACVTLIESFGMYASCTSVARCPEASENCKIATQKSALRESVRPFSVLFMMNE